MKLKYVSKLCVTIKKYVTFYKRGGLVSHLWRPEVVSPRIVEVRRIQPAGVQQKRAECTRVTVAIICNKQTKH